MPAKKIVSTLLIVFVVASLGIMIFREQKARPSGNCNSSSTCEVPVIAPPKLTHTQPATQPAQNSSTVVVYYFHSDMRCRTCTLFEKYTKETLTSHFQKQLETGRLQFQIVNTDKPQNAHYIEDFQLFTKSVVVTLNQDNKITEYTNLKDIWNHVSDPQAFADYISANVRKYLERSK